MQTASEMTTSPDTESPPAGATSPWITCHGCREYVFVKKFERNMHLCPGCGYHHRLTSPQRVAQLLDGGSAQVLHAPDTVDDPLGFIDSESYPDRVSAARAKTGLDEAVSCVRGTIKQHPLVAAVMDFRFMGGSLGCRVGELIAEAAVAARTERVPLLLVTASGGARMQEGALALMQMAKTSQALAELDEAGILTISLVTDPTYGGVAASYATLADVILAEPGARLGFAGPRVIEQTIQQELPEGFQTAEFLFAHGLIDAVKPRAELRSVLAELLRTQHRAAPWRPADSPYSEQETRRQPGLRAGEDAWTVVQRARHSERPTTLDYAHHCLDGFQELHGDRAAGDCPAIVGGVGWLEEQPLMLIGHQKGHRTRDRVARNFGMPSPEGYRKSARLMRLAAKLGLPVVTLIDTPGAYPGKTAEERGQAIAIAENLRLMSSLPVPIVAVITGEGGSGGALALAVADRVLALSNTTYSVISPEGCAAILWHDAGAAPHAAKALQAPSRELARYGIVDEIIAEPDGGAHQDPVLAAGLLRRAVTSELAELQGAETGHLIKARRDRFRGIGRSNIQASGGQQE